MIKKGFLFALLFVALINSVWAFDFYAVCSTGQTLYYNITDANNRYVEVTYPGPSSWYGYTMPVGNLAIPSSVSHNGSTYSVKAVSSDAFSGCTGITSLTLPNSIVSIGDDAFQQVGITTLSLPSSLQFIGSYAFGYTNVETINFPNSLMAMGADAFGFTPWYNSQPNGSVYAGPIYYKYKGEMPPNTTIAVSSGTKGIAGGAFYQCPNMTAISFPNSLQSIGVLAFFACTGLTNITIPSAVVSIAYGAFYQCGLLSSVQYNAQNCVTSRYGYTVNVFEGCYSLTSLSIGNNVQVIPDYLFYGCNSLSGTLSLPSSLRYIGWSAFYNCSGFTGNLTIPTQMDSIGMGAFQGCTGFTTLNYNATNMHNSQYGTYPFSSCTSITSLTIGNNVVSLPDQIFGGCSSISGNVTIPNSVVEIGNYAFVNCSSITSITIGTSVSTISGYPFMQMDNLQSVNYNATNCQSADYMFSNLSNLTSVSIGSNVQRIPRGFVVSCSNLHSITIPNSITVIDDYALYGCGFTGTLTIPQSVNSIGSAAFGAIYNLANIEVLSSTPPTCGTGAFTGTSYYTPLIVPCGSVSAYQNAPGWSDFTTIQETGGCTHQISVLANPSNGGSVQGGGTYNSGANCTVTATPNSNYSFINWTENGTPVSSNTSYSFIVNDDRTLTANFQYQQPSTYTINASSDPANGGTISGAGTYTQGQTCTLIASANSGFAFSNWTENGNVVSTNATYSFTVTGNRTLVAHFVVNPTNYTITVSANPTNGGTVSGGGTYQQGQQCTVSATANSNYTFIKWTENGTQVSTNPTYSFTVNSNRTLVAHFQNQPSQYTITLSANPTNGGTVSGGGTYSQGQTCTVIANANPSYSFVNWTENGTQVSTNSTYSFTVTGNRTLVANFSYSPTGYVINATAEPSYGGLVSGAGTYNQGQTCTLIATPNSNYDFVNWTEGGNVVSTSPTYSFTVNGNRTLVAHFESQVYTISVSANPSDGGTVYGGGDYSAGITCHLIAVPNNNYLFLNWTENGMIVSSESDYSFVITGNRTLTANFIFYDALEEDATNNLTIYPNPAKDIIHIDGIDLAKIEILNAMGQLLLSNEPANSSVELNLRHLPPGIYLVKVYWNGGVACHRLVKE